MALYSSQATTSCIRARATARNIVSRNYMSSHEIYYYNITRNLLIYQDK
jgi:hypothetical protein